MIAQAAQDEFLARNRVANQDIVNLFQLAIELDPSQVTALGSLGIIAFESADYAQAVEFWTRMLDQLPPDQSKQMRYKLGFKELRASESRAGREIKARRCGDRALSFRGPGSS